jgi:hypothetical protein
MKDQAAVECVIAICVLVEQREIVRIPNLTHTGLAYAVPSHVCPFEGYR